MHDLTTPSSSESQLLGPTGGGFSLPSTLKQSELVFLLGRPNTSVFFPVSINRKILMARLTA